MTSNLTKTILIKTVNYKTSKRTVMRIVNAAAKQSASYTVSHHSMNTITKCNYAVQRAHTPIPTTSSQEGLTNNPAYCLYRKNKTIVGQHTEWVEDCCQQKDCSEYSCTEICGISVGNPRAIAHFTHSEEQGRYKLSETDLDNQARPQYVSEFYTNPHEVISQSLDPQKDLNKTQTLQKELENLCNQNEI